MAGKQRVTLQIFYEEFQKRMGGTEDRIGSLERIVVAGLATVNERLSSLEETTSRFGSRLDTLHGLCEHLDHRFERLGAEYHAITTGLKRLEERFDQLEAGRLAERIRILERRVDTLERSKN